MTAFGPFVNTEVIDFEALGEKPLFLINGATGSGKTTILDAICFALYGQTTGKEREAGQMRCDSADDKTLTGVEFVFELGNEQYRIKRIPEQLRAKTKGEGTTRQAADAQLYHLAEGLGGGLAEGLDGGKETLIVARKVSEATKAIEQLTGLQVDQFRQVMVLPQGQFRRLLMADSKDREQIFSQLFETHIYKKIEDKLKAQAKTVYIAVAKLKENQQGVLQSVEFESIETLATAIQTLKPKCKEASLEVKTHQESYLQLVKTHEAAISLANDFDSLDKQRQIITEFKTQANDINLKKEKVEKAELAQKIEPHFTELRRCTKSLKTTTAQLEKAKNNLETSKQSLQQADKELEGNVDRHQLLDEKKQSLTTLKSYRERATSLQLAKDNLKTSQAGSDVSEQSLKASQQQLKTVNEQLENSEKQKEALESALQLAPDHMLEHQKLSDQLTSRQHLDALINKKVTLESSLKCISDKGKVLRKKHEDKLNITKQIELHWHNGQAALLARDLQHHIACPVCGSEEHPSPAKSDLQIPTDQERKSAQKETEWVQQSLQQTIEDYRSRDGELKSLIQQIDDDQKRLGDNANKALESIHKEHQILTEKLNESRLKQQQLDTLKPTLINFKQTQHNLVEILEATKIKHADLNATLESHKALVENSAKELPAEYIETNKLETAIEESGKSIKQLSNVIDVVQQNQNKATKLFTESQTIKQNLDTVLKTDTSVVDDATSQWHEALSNSVFESESDFKSVQLDETSAKLLKSELSAFEKNYQHAQGALEVQQKALKDKDKPDVAALQVELEKTLLEKEGLEEEFNQFDNQLSHLCKAQKTLKNYAKRLEEQEKIYQVIGTLSDVANGVTGNKISLQRFVLGVLLDDVLIVASQRLKVMSKGRYLLIRKENRAKGNKASGLELEVEDSYTGKVRAVSTLSGGESFMASLSLALGLSDVVQAYAGGIRLDTLFIDEGFGSLDADSLELAIRTLIDLRDTGRMVGIISHVSELKEQINLRLDVKSGKCGSYVQMVN